MPELPEVETTMNGVAPWVLGKIVQKVIIRQPQLRWSIPRVIKKLFAGELVLRLERRAKYLLFYNQNGVLLMHLGMSGSLCLVPHGTVPGKHDHVDIIMPDHILRYRDPRRFGAILWIEGDPMQHALLNHLGPEPLGDCFGGDYLYQQSRSRKVAVKNFIMNSRIVVGVGNIYASEALYRAGIRPTIRAQRVSKAKYVQLAAAIQRVLSDSIKAGGTSLKDFVSGTGQPGYFKQALQVYQREGEPCLKCHTLIKRCIIGQRSTFYCAQCQR